MGVQLTKDSIDLGIVTTNPDAMIAFYVDVLGFADEGGTPMPGGTMRRLRCGTSDVKIVSLKKDPPASAPPGGIQGATGLRYWTVSVSNLEDVVGECEAAGRRVVVPVTQLGPDITIAIVEDPDGNWVELLRRG